MAAVKTKLGRIACDCCGHSTLLKQNEAGTLTMACDECDVSAFAKKGTAAAARWRAKLPASPDPDPAPARPQAPAQAPANAQAPGSVPKGASPAPVPPKPKARPFDPLDPATWIGKAA